MNPTTVEASLQEVGDFLLEVATLLTSSGAHTARTMRNVGRISEALGYRHELFFSHSGVMISIWPTEQPGQVYTRFKRVAAHGVNFEVVSAISILSWSALDDKLSLETLRAEVQRIAKLPHYPRWVVLLSVALAGAGFCYIFGGDWMAMAVSALATFCGLWVRQELHKRGRNYFLTVLSASFTSTLLATTATLLPVAKPEMAIATAVLYLVPGVPLINSVVDILQGHIVSGVARFVMAFNIIIALSMGMVIALSIVGIDKI